MCMLSSSTRWVKSNGPTAATNAPTRLVRIRPLSDFDCLRELVNCIGERDLKHLLEKSAIALGILDVLNVNDITTRGEFGVQWLILYEAHLSFWMRHDIVQPIFISFNAEVEAPILIHPRLPNVIGFIVFLGSQRGMLQVLHQ